MKRGPGWLRSYGPSRTRWSPSVNLSWMKRIREWWRFRVTKEDVRIVEDSMYFHGPDERAFAPDPR